MRLGKIALVLVLITNFLYPNQNSWFAPRYGFSSYGSSTILVLREPQDFEQDELLRESKFDLVLENVDDEAEKMCFAYHVNPLFDLASQDDRFSYVGQLFQYDPLIAIVPVDGWEFDEIHNQYVIASFQGEDHWGFSIYFCVVIGKIDDVVFAEISFNDRSLESARETTDLFLQNLKWRRLQVSCEDWNDAEDGDFRMESESTGAE